MEIKLKNLGVGQRCQKDDSKDPQIKRWNGEGFRQNYRKEIWIMKIGVEISRINGSVLVDNQFIWPWTIIA